MNTVKIKLECYNERSNEQFIFGDSIKNETLPIENDIKQKILWK